MIAAATPKTVNRNSLAQTVPPRAEKAQARPSLLTILLRALSALNT